jgi:hypothetical protein
MVNVRSSICFVKAEYVELVRGYILDFSCLHAKAFMVSHEALSYYLGYQTTSAIWIVLKNIKCNGTGLLAYPRVL